MTGKLVNITGNGNVVGDGNVSIFSSSENNSSEINHVFANFYEVVQGIDDDTVKDDVNIAVKKIEEEVKKGDDVDASKVERWLVFLATTAPDVWDVVVDTLTNPIKGISTVVRKIAAKAKAQSN